MQAAFGCCIDPVPILVLKISLALTQCVCYSEAVAAMCCKAVNGVVYDNINIFTQIMEMLHSTLPIGSVHALITDASGSYPSWTTEPLTRPTVDGCGGPLCKA